MRPDPDTVLVWTGAPCSYGCPACPIDVGTAPTGVDAGELARALADLGTGGRLAVLVGGEPFLRPDVLRLIAAIRAAGWQPGLITTGRALVYPQVRDKLHRAGLAYLRVQLFGFGAAHDAATGIPGAFEQAVAAVRAWIDEHDAQCDTDVALTLRGRGLDMLASELDALSRALPQARLVVAIDPAVRRGDDALQAVRQVSEPARDWPHDSTWSPVVWEALSPDATPPGTITVPSMRPVFVGPAPPASCLGTRQPRPITDIGGATHANSFNYVRTATAVPYTASAAECIAYAAGVGADPHRQLWLIEEQQLISYVTDTADFDDGAVRTIKDELSHVFVDRSPPGVLDDFTEGMRRVLPDPVCAPCEHRSHCGRRFLTVDGPPFAREEAWIIGHVSGLRGRVLDVGCGEQLYRHVLRPLLRTGTIDYTGLDPDEPSLVSARAALPEGRFHLAGIEGFAGPAAAYDRILCLRSLNHVRDLDEALSCMSRLLKPGGTLLIVETTPFAMLRRPEQIAAADRAPRAGHQHFRNVASDDVLRLVARHSLEVVEHQPARLETTNEWILLLRRSRDVATDR